MRSAQGLLWVTGPEVALQQPRTLLRLPGQETLKAPLAADAPRTRDSGGPLQKRGVPAQSVARGGWRVFSLLSPDTSPSFSTLLRAPPLEP